MALKNFAYSLVATAPSPASSGTSLVVTAGQGALFPSTPFQATIWPINTQPSTTNAEIVTVTGVSTDTFTIVRTAESTSARTVIVGDQIAATMTALMHQKSINSVSGTTSAGAIQGTDYIYLCTGTFTITLPTAVNNTNVYYIKNVGSGTITIGTTSSQTIDGSTTASLSVQYTSLTLVSDNSNWNII